MFENIKKRDRRVVGFDGLKITVAIAKAGKATVKNVRIEVRGLAGVLYVVLTADKTKPFTIVPEVEISGPEKALPDATVRAFVDLTDIIDAGAPEQMRTLQFATAPGIKVVTTPPTVFVQIKKAPAPPE